MGTMIIGIRHTCMAWYNFFFSFETKWFPGPTFASLVLRLQVQATSFGPNVTYIYYFWDRITQSCLCLLIARITGMCNISNFYKNLLWHTCTTRVYTNLVSVPQPDNNSEYLSAFRNLCSVAAYSDFCPVSLATAMIYLYYQRLSRNDPGPHSFACFYPLCAGIFSPTVEPVLVISLPVDFMC